MARNAVGLMLAVCLFPCSRVGELDTDQAISSVQSHRVKMRAKANEFVVARFRGLDAPSAERYVKELAKKRDHEGLQAIAYSDAALASFAVEELTGIVGPEEAVTTCASFAMGSAKWRAAMFGLCHHPPDRVIPYIRQAVISGQGPIRYTCYQVCLAAGWDDLLRYAVDDMGSDEPVFVFNGDPAESTVGQVAGHYVRAFSAGK